MEAFTYIYHMEEFHLGLTTLLQNLASLVQALKYQEQWKAIMEWASYICDEHTINKDLINSAEITQFQALFPSVTKWCLNR